MNILTGQCDEPKYGECPYCHGNLTADHWCRQLQEARDSAVKRNDPPKLTRMIRFWFAANNVEQAQLAETWGASPSTVSRFLSGEAMPDGRTTAKIIAWLFEP